MKRQRELAAVILVFASLLLIGGCSGKGGDTGSTSGGGSDQPSFRVSSSSQLVALSNTVTSTAGGQGAAAPGLFASLFGSAPQQFRYEIVNQGLSDAEIRARAKGKKLGPALASAQTASITPAPTGTNLLSVDADGNAQLAIDSNYLIKVMYSVTDPAGEYVYLALDTGFLNPDGNDYTQFIAQNNCAFYRVKIADDTYNCVQEGVYIQPIDDDYMQRVSGNQKPIQFDDSGNMYFPGTTFARRCDDQGLCSLVAADWNPLIYRVSSADNSVIAVTQDNQKISYFLALTTGQIAYQSIDQGGNIALYLWQESPNPTMNPNGTTIKLTKDTSAGIDFFSVDTYNTIMWGGWLENGIRFVRPASTGVENAVLDTSILRPRTSECVSGATTSTAVTQTPYPPRRIIVGDDGKLYGVFEESIIDYGKDPNNNNQPYCGDKTKWSYYTVLKVFQVLPYNAVPKLELRFSKVSPDQKFSWQQWMGSTPFQISQNFLYYKEKRERLGYGTYDVIRMVNLSNRAAYTLLGNPDQRYEIYNWRLKGDKLYFAALDLNQTIAVSGVIDTVALRADIDATGGQGSTNNYMTIQQTASAIGATSRVQDIEAVVATLPPSDSGNPTISKVYVSSENVYSASVEFSNYMDEASMQGTTLTDESTSKIIAYMKVWIHKIMHLIPDLDNNGTSASNDSLLDLSSTTPLSLDTPYSIATPSTARDSAGRVLAVSTKTFRTKPTDGWYVSDQYAKFAGTGSNLAATPPYPYYEAWYQLNSNPTSTPTVPTDFRIQFRAKNYLTDGISIALVNLSNGEWPLYISMNSGNVYLNYRSLVWLDPYYGYANTYRYGNASDSLIYNGDWMYYRIDVYGLNVAVSYSVNGTTWSPLQFKYWYWDPINYLSYELPLSTNDVEARPTEARLLIRVSKPVDLDDLLVQTLNASGAYQNTLVDENFDTRTDLGSAPALDGTALNSPNLTTPAFQN